MMNPCIKPNSEKRKIVVAAVKSSTGINHRIELITVADLVHLFALAMGYRPDIAFAFGVISRSVAEVQEGECDVDILGAQKAIKIAALINSCREKQTMPEDIAQAELIMTTTAHVHTVEQAYTELCERVPNIQETFAQQYNDWFKKYGNSEGQKKSLIKRLYGLIRR